MKIVNYIRPSVSFRGATVSIDPLSSTARESMTLVRTMKGFEFWILFLTLTQYRPNFFLMSTSQGLRNWFDPDDYRLAVLHHVGTEKQRALFSSLLLSPIVNQLHFLLLKETSFCLQPPKEVRIENINNQEVGKRSGGNRGWGYLSPLAIPSYYPHLILISRGALATGYDALT